VTSLTRLDDEVRELLSRGRATYKGYVRANCPFCLGKRGTEDRRQSFGVSGKTGKYECYRCGTWGRLRGFIEEPTEREEVPYGVQPPEGFYPLAGDTSLALAPARDYLFRGRGVREELAASLGIGACASGRMGGRVVVPVFGRAGDWLWYSARSWVPKAEVPYLYPQGNKRGLMFNGEALQVGSEIPLLVMEGVFDAIAHLPCAVAVLGKTTEDHLDGLAQARRPVVFVPDGDEWESGYALSLRLRLRGVVSGAIRLPPRVDPDGIGKGELSDLAMEALQTNLD
jgi:hypothetical protein